MSQVIIYQNDEGGVSVIHPTKKALEKYGIEAVALKDVPDGKPFKIVDISEIPQDRTERTQWTVDETDLTDGVGMGATRWFIKELEAKLLIAQSDEYQGPPEKGENPNPEEITEEEYESLYQDHCLQHKQQFEANKQAEIEKITADIQRLKQELEVQHAD
jgi:hypothetical protein